MERTLRHVVLKTLQVVVEERWRRGVASAARARALSGEEGVVQVRLVFIAKPAWLRSARSHVKTLFVCVVSQSCGTECCPGQPGWAP